MEILATRFVPGSDLKASLRAWTRSQQVTAGFVLTAVGSLREACLRLAGRDEGQTLTGPFEIVSLVGTVSPDGLHLHLAIADAEGQVRGGHLLDGCVVGTTAEIAIARSSDLILRRTFDPQTGYKELTVESAAIAPAGESDRAAPQEQQHPAQ